MIMRPPRQPRLDQFGFVGGVVIHDDMDIEIGGHAGVDFLQKRQKFLGSVALVTLADDKAGGNIQGREQRGRSMANVIMSTLKTNARLGGER